MKCVLKTQVKEPKSILFLSQLQKIWDLAPEDIACHYNLIDEMTEVIKEYQEIDRKTKNLISRVNQVLSMLVNLSLAI